MYWLNDHKKRDPLLRWALPDRIFFGRGACHILAGAYLDAPPLAGFHAERIIPTEEYAGNHIYVTNGIVAFDFHGYSTRDRLLAQHRRGWSRRYPGWTCEVIPVDFDLLDTAELNSRKMLGPDQYLNNVLERARRYLGRIDHHSAARRATLLASPKPLTSG